MEPLSSTLNLEMEQSLFPDQQLKVKATGTPPRCTALYMHVTGVRRSTPALFNTIATIQPVFVTQGKNIRSPITRSYKKFAQNDYSCHSNYCMKNISPKHHHRIELA